MLSSLIQHLNALAERPVDAFVEDRISCPASGGPQPQRGGRVNPPDSTILTFGHVSVILSVCVCARVLSASG